MPLRPFLLLLTFCLLPAWPAAPLTLEGTTCWHGDRTFAEQVRVNPGAVLIVERGATITFTTGGLEVAGRLQADGVRFTGRNWKGIALKGTDGGTRLTNCRIEGAATGVKVSGGAPELEKLTLTGNQIGMEVRQSAAIVRDCLFRDNAKVGLMVKDTATPEVTGCRFEQNGRYGAYLFRATPRIFAGNRFTGNPTGLMITHFGSDPAIVDNRFEQNDTGITVERAARPLLAGNLLLDNGTGIRLSRRADSRIEGNRLAGNRLGIEVAYSSYPRIRGNDLEENAIALALVHQSAAWEEANGSAVRQAEASRGAFGQAPRREVTEADRRPRQLAAAVDARENWWGSAAGSELARLGENGNLSFLHDGRDTPTFTEEGKSYPLDRVLFAPWSPAPLTRGKID